MEAKICDRCGAIWYGRIVENPKYGVDTDVRHVYIQITEPQDKTFDVYKYHLCVACIAWFLENINKKPL